jgi:hypothetical protein
MAWVKAASDVLAKSFTSADLYMLASPGGFWRQLAWRLLALFGYMPMVAQTAWESHRKPGLRCEKYMKKRWAAPKARPTGYDRS